MGFKVKKVTMVEFGNLSFGACFYHADGVYFKISPDETDGIQKAFSFDERKYICFDDECPVQLLPFTWHELFACNDK